MTGKILVFFQSNPTNEVKPLKEHEIGRYVHILSRQIKRNIDEVVAEYNVTSVQCAIVEYVYKKSQEDYVFARDIEYEFNLRKSTIAEVLSLMEKNGLIKRENVSKDARLKKIVLTQKAMEIRKNVSKAIEDVEAKMREGLTDEELEEFIRLISKISNNL